MHGRQICVGLLFTCSSMNSEHAWPWGCCSFAFEKYCLSPPGFHTPEEQVRKRQRVLFSRWSVWLTCSPGCVFISGPGTALMKSSLSSWKPFSPSRPWTWATTIFQNLELRFRPYNWSICKYKLPKPFTRRENIVRIGVGFKIQQTRFYCRWIKM